MRTFVPKSTATQLAKSAELANPGRAHAMGIQAKLTVNTPGDIHEQEADNVAAQVMRMPEAQLRRACPCGGGCPRCRAQQSGNHEHLQAQPIQASEAGQGAAPPIVRNVLATSGDALAPTARSFMEPRFGHDFSGVRVHADAAAAQSAESIGALAYTVGHHIVFGAGEYSPGTADGRRLLAHELTHVVQQGHSGFARGDGVVQRQTPGPPEELPLPPRCTLDFNGDKFGPKLKCEGVPGIGSTPAIPVDPTKILPYFKDKAGGLIPKNPPGPTPGGGGPLSPTFTPEVILPPDIVAKILKDYPGLRGLDPQPTLGPAVPFRRQRVLFRHDSPQPGQSLSASLAAGRAAIDDAIATMQSDVMVSAVLIGHASAEGSPERNFGLSDQRVALVYQEFEDAKVSWRVFEPELNFEDVDACRSVGFGRWSCGEEKADQGKNDPQDRNVTIVLYRRVVFQPPPWQLPTPSWKRGGSGPTIGPF